MKCIDFLTSGEIDTVIYSTKICLNYPEKNLSLACLGWVDVGLSLDLMVGGAGRRQLLVEGSVAAKQLPGAWPYFDALFTILRKYVRLIACQHLLREMYCTLFRIRPILRVLQTITLGGWDICICLLVLCSAISAIVDGILGLPTFFFNSAISWHDWKSAQAC